MNEAAVSSEGARLVGPPNSRYSADSGINDRFLRNLDQIGGGNLLRREIPKWSSGNLDQIGGGNLLREVPREHGSDRGERNLDQIGGGNLIRSLIDLRRNLDQIGGGNLVRSFGGSLTREMEPSAEKRND
ncbi:uncharacterized protein LOC108624908 [Ceratina calcarata]|uniref:Uncharacterized protein LOC108624908 n=1 Tax=Ceratina calcarata TaxID=156304 RepID=A0AAJ7IY10_9HYME|nr:uncharacterized protein LOC108624908 [Ceratina calcarata]